MLRKSKTAGFTIVEVLVTVVLLSVVASVFVSFLNNSLKGQKNVQNAVDFDILKANINLLLNSKSCDGAFQTGAVTPTPVTLSLPSGVTWATLPSSVVPVLPAPLPVEQIKQGSSLIVAAEQLLGGGMKVSKLEFTQATFEGDQTVSGTPYKVFTTQLLLEATKQSGSLGTAGYSKNFGVRILVNPIGGGAGNSGTIERCSTIVATTSSVLQYFSDFTPGAAETFTVPAGVSRLQVELWGAGGGGGRAPTTSVGTGGGGGGGYILAVLDVTPGEIFNYTLGAGGGTEVAGGNSTFGNSRVGTFQANGGAPGLDGDNPGPSNGRPGIGGSAIGPIGPTILALSGLSGSTAFKSGGSGGSSARGGGGGIGGMGGGNPSPGINAGGGGGGGDAGSLGGNGASGAGGGLLLQY